jgi:hypothetical protein
VVDNVIPNLPGLFQTIPEILYCTLRAITEKQYDCQHLMAQRQQPAGSDVVMWRHIEVVVEVVVAVVPHR